MLAYKKKGHTRNVWHFVDIYVDNISEKFAYMSGLFTALGLPCSILLHRRKIPFTSFWSSQRRRSSKPFITSNSKRSYSVGTYSEYGVREKFD